MDFNLSSMVFLYEIKFATLGLIWEICCYVAAADGGVQLLTLFASLSLDLV